jgi:predicted AlkP superfamily phosphohydrolase/phosphomutase
MAVAPRRVLVIGLELGDGHLIRSWCDAGLLPSLRRLFESGCWGWLDTTADLLHISAWPSIYTGDTPGNHGVYFTFQPAPGLQGYRRFHEGIYGRPTFWSRLDAAGVRCAVFDPPYSHAEPGFRGSYIHDWGCWAHYLPPGSVPPELIGQLEQACGRFPLGLEANDIGFTRLDPGEMGDKLARSAAAKARAIRWLMQNRAWDLFFTVFGETHAAGHYCWSATLEGTASDRDTPMFKVYQAIDAAIGAIQADAGPDCTTIVISGDRCGSNFAGWHLLPELLARLGYAGGDAQQAANKSPPPANRFDPVKALRDLLPKDFRKSLARRLPTALRDKLAQRVDTADIDWSRTRAYCLPTDLEGYVRINLRGREPQGIVASGDDYARAIRDISSALLELRNPATGGSVVRRVIAADDAFPGDRRPQLPDLIVQWVADGPIRAAASARVGSVNGESPDTRSGTHRGPGFVAAAGPGVAVGATLAAAGILDFAPTILARMGVSAPGALAGKAWPELLDF